MGSRCGALGQLRYFGTEQSFGYLIVIPMFPLAPPIYVYERC